MRKIIVYFIVFHSCLLAGQVPGGVGQPILWEMANNENDKEYYGNHRYNYNPYYYIESPLKVALTKVKSIEKIVAFVVYNAESDKENVLTMYNDKAKIVFKESAINVDSNTFKLKGTSHTYPRIICYSSSNTKFNDSIEVFVGDTNNNQYDTHIGWSELIVYDRLLNLQQKRNVFSYLAMKYGIPLNDSIDYFNSDGKLIWSYITNHPFNKHNVALGKDLTSGLNQFITNCVTDSLSLVITMKNSDHLTDKSFLFISDNGKDFHLDDNNNQRIYKLQYNNASFNGSIIQVQIPSYMLDKLPYQSLSLEIFSDIKQLPVKSIPFVNYSKELISCEFELDDLLGNEFYFRLVDKNFLEIQLDIKCIDNVVTALLSTDALEEKFIYMNNDVEMQSSIVNHNTIKLSGLHGGDLKVYRENDNNSLSHFWINENICRSSNESVTVQPSLTHIGEKITIKCINSNIIEFVENIQIFNTNGQLVQSFYTDQTQYQDEIHYYPTSLGLHTVGIKYRNGSMTTHHFVAVR